MECLFVCLFVCLDSWDMCSIVPEALASEDRLRDGCLQQLRKPWLGSSQVAIAKVDWQDCQVQAGLPEVVRLGQLLVPS